MNEFKVGDRVRVNPALLFGLAGEFGVVDSITDDNYLWVDIDGECHELHKDFLINDLLSSILDIDL